MVDATRAMTAGRAGWGAAAVVGTAVAVTTLDGFDSMLLSLTAPQIIKDLGIPTASMGPVFGSIFIGLLAGALVGGAVADRIGHVRALVASLVLFGLAGLLMPWMDSARAILINRIVAGIGLGAAAPIAVGLMVASGALRAPTFAVATVWSGIALGGVLAAVLVYLAGPLVGWHWLFIAGGIAVVPVAAAVAVVYRGHGVMRAVERRLGIWTLFGPGVRGRSVLTAAMFFFGYVVTSMLVSWLPTVLTHRGASPLLVSSAFVAFNVGGFIGATGLGFLAQLLSTRVTLPVAWVVAGLCLLAMALPAAGTAELALLAAVGGTVATGCQALSVAVASRLIPGGGLEATSVGTMVSTGRLGQISALNLSGLVLAQGLAEQSIFAIAGASAVVAAVCAVFLMRREEAL